MRRERTASIKAVPSQPGRDLPGHWLDRHRRQASTVILPPTRPILPNSVR
jgi:hypothetical protein